MRSGLVMRKLIIGHYAIQVHNKAALPRQEKGTVRTRCTSFRSLLAAAQGNGRN